MKRHHATRGKREPKDEKKMVEKLGLWKIFNYESELIWYDQRVSYTLTVLHYAVIWVLLN